MLEKLISPYFYFFDKERNELSIWKKSFTLILLLIICNVYAYKFLIHNQRNFAFYQTEFSPAVMFACGYGFKKPVDDDQEIKSFLNNEQATLNCQDIQFTKFEELAPFQATERYLMFSTAIFWKVLGVNWVSLIPLFLLLYSASVAAVYFIFRLGMGQTISFALTLLVALSPSQMRYLLLLRDYSVSPFLLWFVWITGKQVIDCGHSQNKIILSALSGLLIGLGFGFRSDLLILIPYYVLASLIFFKKKDGFLIDKLLPLALFFLCFFISAYPILYSTSKQGNFLAHVIILGLSNDFTQNLKLIQPKIYTIIPYYRDLVAFNVTNSFAERMADAPLLLVPPSKEYEYYGFSLLYNYICYYPADVLIRIYASIYQILVYSYQNYSGALFYLLNKSGLFFPLCSFLIIALYEFRLAWFLLFSIIYLCAYPALQFDPRHYFYLAFVGFWFIGFTVNILTNLTKSTPRKLFLSQLNFITQAHLRKILFITVLLLILMYSLLYISRIYQTAALTNLYNQYLKLPSQEVTRVRGANNTIKVILPTTISNPKRIIQKNLYLKIIMNPCSTSKSSLNLNYLEQPDLSWGAPTAIDIPSGPGVYFYPIYNFHNPGPKQINVATLPSYWIVSINYQKENDSCFQSFSIVDTRHQAPLMETLNLQSDWAAEPLYQHF